VTKSISFISLFFACVSLFGGAVINNSNFSAEYIRTLSRNASTDSADAAVYNPAGTALMKNGLYLNFSSQTVFKKYTVTDQEYKKDSIVENEYISDNTIPIIPSLFLVYKKNYGALFASFHVSAGGGSVIYEKGLPRILFKGTDKDEKGNPVPIPDPRDPRASTSPSEADPYYFNTRRVEGFSAYYATTIGGAYQINKYISLAVGLRHTFANTKAEIERGETDELLLNYYLLKKGKPMGSLLVDFEGSSNSLGFVLGAAFTPIKDVVISMRYESNTRLKWDIDKNDGLSKLYGENATRYDRDLPAVLAFGVSSKLTRFLKLDFSSTVYFNNKAKWSSEEGDKDSITPKTYDNGIDLALAIESKPVSFAALSAGVMYTKSGADSKTYYVPAPELDSISVAGGTKISLPCGTDLNLGLTYIFYKSASPEADLYPWQPPDGVTADSDNSRINLEKIGMILAAGLQKKF